MTEEEMKATAAEKGRKGREELLAMRLAEGWTLEELEAVRALAEATVIEKLERGTVVGTTESGRVKFEHGEPGPATRQWMALKESLSR